MDFPDPSSSVFIYEEEVGDIGFAWNGTEFVNDSGGSISFKVVGTVEFNTMSVEGGQEWFFTKNTAGGTNFQNTRILEIEHPVSGTGVGMNEHHFARVFTVDNGEAFRFRVELGASSSGATESINDFRVCFLRLR